MGNKQTSTVADRPAPCYLCRRTDVKDNVTVPMRAAKNGHPECLLHANIHSNAFIETLDILSRDNKTALSFAAMHGHYECVDILIRAGASVNCPFDFPPILEAARKGHYRCVDIMIQAAADMNEERVSLNDLVCQARIDNDDVTADVLMHLGADMSVVLSTAEACLISAVANSYIQCIVSLISAGVDVNIDFECHSSALMVAAAAGTGSFRCLKVLLAVGAHVNVINVDGKNALQICIAQSRDKKREKCLLLYAAGEHLDMSTDSFSFLGERYSIPEYLQQSDQRLRLKYMCRERIRRHLLDVDRHVHLFSRITELRQTPLITNYLLYGMTLD